MYDGNHGKCNPKFSGNISGMNNPPDCFNIENLVNIEDYQIGWCDETHTKLIISFFNLNRNTRVIQFYSGSDGMLLVSEMKGMELSMKNRSSLQ